MSVLNLTVQNFEETIAEGKCLVDFWAAWCGPCKMLAAPIEELGEKYAGKAKICKVNVDEEGELAQRFGIMSIPTVLALENGKETGRTVGVVPKETLEKLITKT